MSNFGKRSWKRGSRASSASMASRVCSLMRPSYSWKPRAVARSGRAARWPRIYSSATRSSSASGLRAGVGFGEGEGFGERERAGEGDADEAGEADESGVGDGEGEDFCLGGRVGFSEGVGVAS